MPQFFETPNGEEFVILSQAEYDTLVAAEHDLTRILAAERLREGTLVAAALAKGGNPVKAIRTWRGLTQGHLADAANLSKSYISRLENGKAKPSHGTRKAAAAALNVPESLLRL